LSDTRKLRPPGDASRVAADRELRRAPARSHQSVVEYADPGFSGARIRLSPEWPLPQSVGLGHGVEVASRRVDQGHEPERARVPSVKTLDVKILVAVALSVIIGLSVVWLATSFYGATRPSAIPGR
jgi:hypothetical protein